MMGKKSVANNRNQSDSGLSESLKSGTSSRDQTRSSQNVEKPRHKKRQKDKLDSSSSSRDHLIKFAGYGLIFSSVVALACMYNVEAFEFGGVLCDEGLKVLVKLGLLSNESVITKDETKTPIPGSTDERKILVPGAKYKYANITNKEDNKIRSKLDEADATLGKNHIDEAIKLYSELKTRYPDSPRAVYGKANALDKQSERKQSNQHLEEAIEEYLQVLDMRDVPKELFLTAGRIGAERQAFRGWGYKATQTLQKMIKIYPDEFDLWNQLGIQFLMIGRNEDARQTFKQVLEKDPQNGVAMVHLGFIMKATDKNYEGAIPFLQAGLATNQKGVIDGRFFFQLGDALYRTGKHNQSYEVYKEGADRGVFLSMWQRSLYNIPDLTSRPWWTMEQTGIAAALKTLEKNWKTIRDEGLANLDEKSGVFKPEEEDLREKGDWKQFTLYQQGRRNDQNCKRAPKTCALVEKIPEATSCKRGQIKFSVMQPGVHVWPHCGPTNCRIRCHLGLVTPPGPLIRAGNETNTWIEGKFIIFDDSFEHEVWHEGTSVRLVLILDIWHPELTVEQRKALAPI